MQHISDDEWSFYFDVLAPEAMRLIVFDTMNKDLFWKVIERIPNLANIAITL